MSILIKSKERNQFPAIVFFFYYTAIQLSFYYTAGKNFIHKLYINLFCSSTYANKFCISVSAFNRGLHDSARSKAVFHSTGDNTPDSCDMLFFVFDQSAPSYCIPTAFKLRFDKCHKMFPTLQKSANRFTNFCK